MGGHGHRTRENQVPYDAHRTRWLETQGYRVLRFWNNEVLAHTNAVAQTIFWIVLRSEFDPPP